jgi:hypothetical protein
MRVRLDRAVDQAWRDIFSKAKVHHLVSSRSNHCPVFIEPRRDVWDKRNKGIFRYEIMWGRVGNLPEEIKKQWCSDVDKGNLDAIVQNLSKMQGALRQWSKQHFCAVSEELKCLHGELEEAKGRHSASRSEIQSIADRMDEILYPEEMMWLQCSRISWFKEGNRNTRFFHMQEKWRAQKNK